MTKRLLASVFLVVSFASANGQYTYVGSANTLGNNCYEITPNSTWENGALWYDESIDLNEPFHLQYEASFGDNPAGADGMVFVLQNVGNNILGLDGGGMGFSGFLPSFGVEFDTFQNADLNDPAFDHIAFLRNGNNHHNNPDNLAGPVQTSSVSPNVKDGQYHTVDIYWYPGVNQFEVWFDCVLRLSTTINLIQNVFQGDPIVFWGFTGATGGFTNQHVVCVDPNILGLPAQYEICEGENIALEGTGSTAGDYSWAPTSFLNNPSIPNPIASPPTTTTYSLTFTDLCENTQEQITTVVVHAPSVSLPDDIEACTGAEVTIAPLESNGALLWSDGSTTSEVNTTVSGNWTVTATEGDCVVSDEITITFTDNPELPLMPEVEICEGESHTVDLSTTGFSITWEDEPDAGAVRTFSEPGSYTAVAQSANCTTSATMEIIVQPLPSFDLGEDRSACTDEIVTLTVEVGGAEVSWNTGQTSDDIVVNESGYYEATATLNGCTFTDGVDVLLTPNPEVTITGATTFCEGESTLLAAAGADSYVWSNGATGTEVETALAGTITVEGFESGSGCSGSASLQLRIENYPSISLPERILKCEGKSILLIPSISHADTLRWNGIASAPNLEVILPGVYTAQVVNRCGELSATVQVEDEECFQEVWIPNTFTPDGDGLNDLFYATGEGIKRFSMEIFDRWGTKVFETKDIDSAWNGSFQNGGYYCEAGIYAVRIEIEYEDKALLEKVGHVMLLR